MTGTLQPRRLQPHEHDLVQTPLPSSSGRMVLHAVATCPSRVAVMLLSAEPLLADTRPVAVTWFQGWRHGLAE